MRRDLDLGARRHPRAQRIVGSIEQNLGLEEGDVGLGRFGVARAADLDHLAGVLAVGDRVHLQDHALTLGEMHDLGLVDVDLGQDLRQVGDRADDRSRVVHRARDHHLADLGVQGDHPAGDRRVDRRLAQIVLRLDEHRPGLRHRFARLLDREVGGSPAQARRLDRFDRGDSLGRQLFGACQPHHLVGGGDLRLLQAGAAHRELGARVVPRRQKGLALELEERRAGGDRGPFDDVELLDLADDVGRDVDLDPRLDLAAGLDALGERLPARDLDIDLLSGFLPTGEEAADEDRHQDEDAAGDEQIALHERVIGVFR